jgi:predicted nucleic acid-binding protein
LNKPVFYDADCLECFLFVDAGYILEELFSKIIIPEQVYDEIMFENTPTVVKKNFEKLKKGFVEIREISFASQEYYTFRLIREGCWSKTGQVCGPGESAAMALAHLNNGIVASNNLSDVSEYVESLDIELITSSMILTQAVKKEIITESTANSLWVDMIGNGIDLPKDSFSEYYDELYEIDCEKFLKDTLFDR